MFPAARRALCLTVGCWMSVAVAVTAAPATVWLQPAQASGGLSLEQIDRTVRVHLGDGPVRTLRLRPGERLTVTAELGEGWAAAGIRERGDTQEIFLLTAPAGAPRRVDVPAPAPNVRWRARPVPLIGAGSLEGVAWLEGSLSGPRAVRAAAYTSAGWLESETVAALSSGSLSGLTGATLADGSWLLVWCRFDGEDDEILWSVRRNGLWSPPRAVAADNAVPDVTPTLFPLDDGAVLAWSRLVDGEYRVLISRSEGESWTLPAEISGPGGLYPGFAGLDGTPYLLIRAAWPAGWVVMELDPSGRPLRRAIVPADDPGRPALRIESGRPMSLRLPAPGSEPTLSWEVVP